MTNEEIKEIQKGIDWVKELLENVQQPLGLPQQYERRIAQIKCNNILIKKTSKSFFYCLSRFFLGIGYINFLFLKSFFSRQKFHGNFSIWDSNVSSFVSNNTFKEFLDSDQVVQRKIDGIIIVKSKNSTASDKNTFFMPEPIYNSILHLQLSFFDIIWLNTLMVRKLIFFVQNVKKWKNANEIFKDFLTGPIVQLYKKKGLKKIFRTNAEISSQEFWCQDVDFNTVWYSINSRTMIFKDIPFESILEHPFFYLSHFGTSWTWNQSSANWLTHLHPHHVKIVGPILFTPIVPMKKKTLSKKRLLVFDVTPFSTQYLREQVLHHGVIYINEKMSISFIENILLALKDFDWDVSLKPKRAYGAFHSQKYISFLQEKVVENKKFRIIEPSTNLVEEIMQSDIVISIPLTSPFEIAKFLGIPTYYMDPTGTIDFAKMGYSAEDVIPDVESLKEMVAHLNSNP